MLVLRNLPTEHVAEPRFDTTSSINFTNISYEREVVLLKGSVFDESLEKVVQDNSNKPTTTTVDNIDSMYHNAQMILDDLSSRPLTRTSIPLVTNTVTPASRLNMYELHRQEEQKVRLPFCIQPKKQ